MCNKENYISMEATLQKTKSKKQNKKSKHSSRTEVDLASVEIRLENFHKNEGTKFSDINLEQPHVPAESDCAEGANCDNYIKNENVKLQEVLSEKLVKSAITHSSPSLEESSTTLSVINSVKITKSGKNEDDLCTKENVICDKISSDTVIKSISENSINQMEKCSTDTTIKQEKLHSSEETFLEKTSLNVQCNATKAYPLHLYPDLKHLEHSKKVDSILSSQMLVRTTAEKFKTKTAVKANECYKDFVKILEGLEEHPLMDMIDQYQRAKKSSAKFRSRLRYLKSDLKRKKDNLWKTVKKEVTAKGKCEDGYSVNVKQTYTIEELDQERFNEVKNILKEIRELLLSDAFHSYLEEVMRLRIDHYIHELIKNDDNDPKYFGERFSDEICETDSIQLKKSISVLFHSQRQNVQDPYYLSTCQSWLKTLTSKMIQNGGFDDTLLVLNHIIRCPSGIANWAVELIQIPANISEVEESEIFNSDSAQQILLALFLILNPVPLKEYFLKNIKDSPSADPADKFAVLDSDGEEEEIFEMSRNFSDADILSLLNQIPIRSLYKNFLLDDKGDPEKIGIRMLSDGEMLKLFAYSTAIIDVLFTGLETHYSENYELFFETISNLIRHILLYISKYWIYHVKMNSSFKSEFQAVYDKLFFHVVYKIYNFEKIHIWKILPALPYAHISEKMLWNILWVFFSPRKTEEQICSEKDVEIKVKDDCVHTALINHIKDLPVHDIYHLLNAIEKIIKSCSFTDKDFIKFSFYIIFKLVPYSFCAQMVTKTYTAEYALYKPKVSEEITMLEPTLSKNLSNEGLIILKDIAESFPVLVSELLRNIDENFDNIPDSQQCITLFMKLNISNWVPEDSDIYIISSWLMLNLNDVRKQLACLILKKLNWDFKQGQLFLPYDIHKRIAVIVVEAYVKFDENYKNEGLVSKGVKQMLQFTSMGNQKEEEKFVHWAWNILFSLKLHPMDRKNSPWVEIYDGYIEDCNDPDCNSDLFQSLLSAYEKKHPSACYLMLVMSNEGRSLKGLLNGGLDCFSSLVESEQYMAAINSLYYILPFFVKHSDELLEKTEFIKALSNLITADLTVISNITRKPVIGAVLHKVASVIKYQIYQAVDCTIECAAPLLKLWIKILMRMMSPLDNNASTNLKNYAEQIHFLLDVCVKISFLHDYTRDSVMDLFSSYCNPLSPPKAQPVSFWYRMFYSNSSEYPILNRNIIPEYPWLAWIVLYSEIKQKNVEDLCYNVSREMMKNINDSSAACLKKISQILKNLEFLPIYRWALQAVKTPISHPVSPLIWQQFFLYFFQKLPVPNSENFISIGLKYFKNGQFEWLLKKMKLHLTDAESYYRNLSKSPEIDRTEASEGLKSEKDKSFYSSLARLFHAFNLWIDTESLHESSVCFSALEPKFCPEWLELVLNGDKRIWYVLLSIPLLKDDIDQKIHSWSFSKKISNEILESSSKTEESLPKQLQRHINRYETTLPVVKTETVSVIPVERNEMVFTSKDEIVNIIERNQALIFDKARYFCEQMKKLEQLNFNYINWIPQEYEIEDNEITLSKVCHKGNGKDCSGAAYFRLKIQKCNKNIRISEKIENNRADYVIVEDQLSKLPVNDLCLSSLYIENCIRSLANKIKQANIKDTEYYRKMGIALFYHQMKRIDQVITSVADYPPSRQFFSLIIESLGREFLDGNDAELVELAKSILTHPESGSLALPLFNPNKSSIDNFLKLYNLLTSSVGKHSASTVLALFSKVDLNQWLCEYAPSFEARKNIFNDICNALLVCGYNPSSDILPVFDILRRHFGILLKYMFPDLFLPSIDFLLKGMEDECLCIDVYYEAFSCFGCPLFNDKTNINDIEFALRKFAENQQLPVDQKMFVSVAQLNLPEVSYVSHLLYDHFINKRYSVELYKRYSAFIKPLSIFLAVISHSLVALHLEEISSINEPLCISELWKTFHLPFWPWLHPMANSSGLHFPWTDKELNDAHYMFKIFILSLKYFHNKVLNLGYEENVLSCLWLFYVKTYVSPGYRHYLVSVCHNELLNLPWHEFHPCTEDIEGMCKVLQSNLHESKEFLSKMSLKIPWSNVMQKIPLTKPPDYVGKVLATLAKLLIISQLDCAENDRDNLDLNIFKEMESLTWQYVSINDIEALLDLAYSRLDPLLVVSNWNTGCEFYVLQFLKLICCMIPNLGAEDYSNSKRILYLKKFISTLSACCSSKATQMTKMCHKISDIMSTLLDEIKVIICHVASPNEQVNYALPLVKEILILLNSLPEGELSMAVLNSVTSWLSLNKTSPLLLPCIKVSSQNLNSVSHKVHLIECCISTRFRDETLDARETQIVWLLISSYFPLNSKNNEEFVKKCVEENAYFTLYCCILHKLPQSESVESKKVLLEQIFSWIKEPELRCDAEAKFILLWDKLLELSIKLVYEQEYQIVRNVITAFCWTLENLAQDKSKSGFFAVIGFGQASSLSVNFRFLCRVMIAYLQYQVPGNQPIRIEPTDMENSDTSSSSASSSNISSATKALENLKALQKNKLYSALHSQIDYAAKCVIDPKYTFLQSREVLKYFAAVLYPKDSYLSALDV